VYLEEMPPKPMAGGSVLGRLDGAQVEIIEKM